MTAGKELWYLTRGSGVVALVLLTAGVLLGILSSLGARTNRWPRFAVGGAHKNLTLLSVVFVVFHVVTTVADGYAPIRLTDAVVPFASPYRPVWLGLGAVAFDLLLALVITSYLRHRIGFRTWRGVTGSRTAPGRSRCCTRWEPAAMRVRVGSSSSRSARSQSSR